MRRLCKSKLRFASGNPFDLINCIRTWQIWPKRVLTPLHKYTKFKLFHFSYAWHSVSIASQNWRKFQCLQIRITHPNNFGLNSFRMFGNVKCVRKFPWPPIHQERPRFSISTSHRAAELAAVALVNESPTAAIMSISPVSKLRQLTSMMRDTVHSGSKMVRFHAGKRTPDKLNSKIIKFHSVCMRQ